MDAKKTAWTFWMIGTGVVFEIEGVVDQSNGEITLQLSSP